MTRQTLFITIGLPASGKSTWAKKLVHDNPGQYKRINKDDLRAMLNGSARPGGKNEKFVLAVQKQLISNALENGYDVICDDTNIHPKYLQSIENNFKNVEIELVIFDVPMEVCIQRDAQRENKVGRHLIERMAANLSERLANLNTTHKVTYVTSTESVQVKAVYDPNLRDAIIYDIDGTVALMNGRGPYEWTRVGEDSVNEAIAEIIRVYNKDYFVFAVSGRDGSCRELTENWLCDNNIPFDGLFMREAGDSRKDSIVKMEIFEREFKGKYNVRFVLDDRNQVVAMWRSLGLTCLQVADGDF